MAIKIIISTFLTMIIALLSYQFLLPPISPNGITSTYYSVTQNSSKNHKTLSTRAWPSHIEEIISTLHEQYIDKIHHIHIQAKLITIRESLLEQLPEPIILNLQSLLAEAFPNYEMSILNSWSKMDEYQQWLMRENKTLMELNDLSRNGMLWEKRKSLFPNAAEDIWSEEQDKYEIAQLNLHNEIDILNVSSNIPMSERIIRLKQSFFTADNLFTDTTEQNTSIHSNTIASVLFGLSSVQAELKELEPELRQAEIEAIRRELGYDEDTIIKMSNIDKQREDRWTNGYAYMKSREDLLENNEQVSDNQMNELRHQYFGNSALTIAREELSGFYRFQRPRYYGRN